MHIQYASDLHLEHRALAALHTDLLSESDADLIVLAGDIGVGVSGVHYANSLAAQQHKPVLYVAGNHEFYGHDYPGHLQALRAAAGANVFFLEQDRVVLGGVRFLGTTLWTDFALFGDAERAMREVIPVLADYRWMTVDGQPLQPEQTLAWHQCARRWLAAELAKPFAGATVVISHHAPHRGSLAPRWATDVCSAGFVSECTELLGPPAALWIHGHTHTAFDYAVEGTRVVCNPAGYPGETAGQIALAGYAADRVVTISSGVR